MTPMLERMVGAQLRLSATCSRRSGAERVLAKAVVDEAEARRNRDAVVAEGSPDDVAAFDRWCAAQTLHKEAT